MTVVERCGKIGAEQEREADMYYSDFHTHTTYSDGKQSLEENILAAIARGMSAIGFSDHSFTEFGQDYCIKKADIALYIAEVRRLGEKYRDRIEVYLGMEVDGYTELENRECYDYILGDCHCLKTENGFFSIDHSVADHIATAAQYGGDFLAMAKAYYEDYEARMVRLKPDVLAHFDLVAKFGYMPEEDRRYRSCATECLLACLRHTPLVELNTGAIARGHRSIAYPAPYLLDELRLHGGHLVFGSDSHRIENLGFGFSDAIAYIKEHGFQSIVALKEGKWQEIGI